jgi:hypothetical protein
MPVPINPLPTSPVLGALFSGVAGFFVEVLSELGLIVFSELSTGAAFFLKKRSRNVQLLLSFNCHENRSDLISLLRQSFPTSYKHQEQNACR